MLLAWNWMADQGLVDGLVLKRQVMLTKYSGWIITVTVEWNIKFDNNDLLIPCALLPKGEKGEIGCQSTQDSSTTSTNPTDHNTPQQEITEPPVELTPENQDPQQNNYLGVDFNCADPEEPAAHSQWICKPSTHVKQLQSGSFISDG